jgi:hypothetical protein
MTVALFMPFRAAKSRKRQQVPAQDEGRKPPDFTGGLVRFGNIQRSAARGG